MKQSIRITSRVNKRFLRGRDTGHFATNHSHINYYIDMSEIKHRMAMSREARAQHCIPVIVHQH